MLEEVAEPLDDGQSHAQPSIAISLGVIYLIELPEDHFQLVGGNSESRVPPFQGNPFTVPPRGYQDPAASRVAQRVLNQVGEYPLEQQRVAQNDAPSCAEA